MTHNSETEALTLEWPDADLACPDSSRSHVLVTDLRLSCARSVLAVKLVKKYRFFSVVVMLQLILVLPVHTTAPTDARLDLLHANATNVYKVARHAVWTYVPPAAAFGSDERLRLAFNATRIADAAHGVVSSSCDVDMSRFVGWWSDGAERSPGTHVAVAFGLIFALAVGIACVSTILPTIADRERQRRVSLKLTKSPIAADSAASQPPVVLGAVDPSMAEAAPSPSPSPPAWDPCSPEAARDVQARVSRLDPSPPGWDLLVGSSKQDYGSCDVEGGNVTQDRSLESINARFERSSFRCFRPSLGAARMETVEEAPGHSSFVANI